MVLFAVIGESTMPGFWYVVFILFTINVRFNENSKDNMKKMKDT